MEGKKIVVIGGSGGIGSVLLEDLLAQGASIFNINRNREFSSDLINSDNYIGFNTDFSLSDNAKIAFQKVGESFGSIDGVVNLSGSIFLKPAHLTSDEDFDNVINQNVKTAFNAIKYSIPLLTNPSSIILMSSVAGLIGLPNHEAIASAKAAIIGLTKSAAATYAQKGIRINCIAPGLVETPMSQRITSNKNALEASMSMHPLGRIGKAEDIAPFISMLLSEKSSWISGQVFGIDGGLSVIK